MIQVKYEKQANSDKYDAFINVEKQEKAEDLIDFINTIDGSHIGEIYIQTVAYPQTSNTILTIKKPYTYHIPKICFL